jgi:hypothetical protein
LIDHSQVLVKTAKGKEEIRTKAFDLAPRVRRALLLVDGESTVATILARLAVLGDDVESQLESLLADGFLAPRGSALDLGTCRFDDWQGLADRHLAAPDSGPDGATGTQTPRFNLEKAKGFARFIVLGCLGPAGAYRVERMDAARSVEALRAELGALRDILPKLLQKRQAKEVWDQLEPLMLAPDLPAASWAQGPRRQVRDAVRAAGGAKAAVSPRVRERDKGSGFDSTQSRFAARILEYAEPLTHVAAGGDAQKRAVQMAIICWNAAMLPGNRGLETIAPALREIANGERRLERELFAIFEIMRMRKHAHFRDDHRFIVDFSLDEGPDGWRLRLASKLLDPEGSTAAVSSA